MSGKKDWEVADLLEEGIKARKRTESNLNNAIGSNTKLIHKAGEELANTKGTVKAVQALNNEAGVMFGNKGKEKKYILFLSKLNFYYIMYSWI